MVVEGRLGSRPRLGGGRERDFREVDGCVGDVVQVVRENVQGDVRDDLDDLGVGDAGGAGVGERGVREAASRLVDGDGESEERRGTRVGRPRASRVVQRIGGKTDGSADGGVRGETVAAAVGLRDGDRDQLAGLGSE